MVLLDAALCIWNFSWSFISEGPIKWMFVMQVTAVPVWNSHDNVLSNFVPIKRHLNFKKVCCKLWLKLSTNLKSIEEKHLQLEWGMPARLFVKNQLVSSLLFTFFTVSITHFQPIISFFRVLAWLVFSNPAVTFFLSVSLQFAKVAVFPVAICITAWSCSGSHGWSGWPLLIWCRFWSGSFPVLSVLKCGDFIVLCFGLISGAETFLKFLSLCWVVEMLCFSSRVIGVMILLCNLVSKLSCILKKFIKLLTMSLLNFMPAASDHRQLGSCQSFSLMITILSVIQLSKSLVSSFGFMVKFKSPSMMSLL